MLMAVINNNFIYGNRWQLDSACGLWFADPDLQHKLHHTEAYRETSSCAGPAVAVVIC